MGKIRFNLRKPKSNTDTPIYMIYQRNKKTLVYPVGLYVQPQNWDFKKQQFKGRTGIVKKSNQQLELYKLELQTILLDLKINKETFTKKKVKTALDKRFNAQINNDFTILNYTIIVHEQLIKTNKYGFNKLIFNINRFKSDAVFDDIDINFYNQFCDYLFNLNLTRSYINSVMIQLKRIWKIAQQEGITKNNQFSIINKFENSTDHIALNLNDLKVLYDYVITEPIKTASIETANKIKNRFLIGCFTGLRVSDWNKIQHSNIQTIDGQQVLIISTQKTAVTCAIPLNIFPLLNNIIDSYNGNIPQLSQKELNQINPVLKEICKKAGLTRVTTKTVWKRKKTTIQRHLFNRITTHTARRTFVTIMLNKGYSENEIKKMTGHKSSLSFNKYDKQKAVENAINVSKSINKLKAI